MTRRTRRGKGQEVEGLEDFIHELGRFYARGKGDEFDYFEFQIASIAEDTLGFPCFFEVESPNRKVLYEQELIKDTLFYQEREDILVCGEDEKVRLRLKLRHKVYVVDIGDGDWIGWAPIEIDSVEVV